MKLLSLLRRLVRVFGGPPTANESLTPHEVIEREFGRRSRLMVTATDGFCMLHLLLSHRRVPRDFVQWCEMLFSSCLVHLMHSNQGIMDRCVLH